MVDLPSFVTASIWLPIFSRSFIECKQINRAMAIVLILSLFLTFQSNNFRHLNADLPLRFKMINLIYLAGAEYPTIEAFGPLPCGHPGVDLDMEPMGPHFIGPMPLTRHYPATRLIFLPEEEVIDFDDHTHGRPLPTALLKVDHYDITNYLLSDPTFYPVINFVMGDRDYTRPRYFPIINTFVPQRTIWC